MTPSDLAYHLDVAPSRLSFHLKELLYAGLISQERDGRNLIYRAQLHRMDGLLSYLTAHCCGGQACVVTATRQPLPSGATAQKIGAELIPDGFDVMDQPGQGRGVSACRGISCAAGQLSHLVGPSSHLGTC